jgi:hypothetical protein
MEAARPDRRMGDPRDEVRAAALRMRDQGGDGELAVGQ